MLELQLIQFSKRGQWSVFNTILQKNSSGEVEHGVLIYKISLRNSARTQIYEI